MILVILENSIIVPKKGLDDDALDGLRGLYTYVNPNFNPRPDRTRYWEKDTREKILTYEEDSTHFYLPSGSIIKLNKYLKSRNLGPIYVDRRIVTPSIDISWNPDKKLKKKWNQKEAIVSFLGEKIGIVSKPCGTGKTVIGVYIMTLLKQKTIILVNKKILVKQWRDALMEFGKFNFPIGMIGDGEFNVQPITIILKQTHDKVIFNEQQSDFIRDEFGFLIIDECHHVSSDLIISGVSLFNSRYKMGLSATPYRKDKLDFLMFDYVGPVVYREKSRDSSISMEVEFKEDKNFTYRFGTSWPRMINALSKNQKRNERIVDDIVELVKKKYCVGVLSRRIKQCQWIHQELLKRKVNSRLLIGETSKFEQDSIKKDAEKGLVDVVVGSVQIFLEGVDIPPLSCIMMVTPENNKLAIEQGTGRAMREWEGKNSPLFVYYVDSRFKVLASVSINVSRWCNELNIKCRKVE